MPPPPSSWQESLDSRLVRYLLRPATQPGLISCAVGRHLIERVQSFIPVTLGDEMLQRWSALLGEHGPSVPIVHATPVPDEGLSYPTWAPPTRGEQPAPPTRATPSAADASPPLTHPPLGGAAAPAPAASAPIGSVSRPSVPTSHEASAPPSPPAAPARPVLSDVIQRKEMPPGSSTVTPATPLPLAPLPPLSPSGGGTMEAPSALPSAPPPVRPVVRGVRVPLTLEAMLQLRPALPVVYTTPSPRPSAPTRPLPASPAQGAHSLPPLPVRAELGTPAVARPDIGALRLPAPETPRSDLPQGPDQPTTRGAEPESHQPSPPPLRVVRETRREGAPPASSERLVVGASPPVATTLPPATPPRWVVRERPAQEAASLPALPAGSSLLLGLPPMVQAPLGAGSAPEMARPAALGTLPPILGAPPVVTGRMVASQPPASAPWTAQASGPTATDTPPTAAPVQEPDMEQLAERVQRRLLQALAVERERRGEGRW